MAGTNPLRFVDRSRITTDWTCPRKRYWQYEFGGRGIQPDVTSLELFLGTAIHDGLARIGDAAILAASYPHAPEMYSIDTVASQAHTDVYDSLSATPVGEVPDPDTLVFAAEQAALVEGMLRGFYRYGWPRLLQEGWKVVAVEKEVIYSLSAILKFMSKPDLILEDPEGNWWYVEFKSTSSKKGSWIDQWATAVQLHSSCKAVEETLGHEVTGVIVQGLYKGYESYGRQNSPFCYAYVRAGNPPFTADQVRYDYQAGFRRQPVWERPGGVAAWVAAMPDEILADQFPQVPPIFIKEELIARFFAQVKDREEDILCGASVIEACREYPDGISHETGLTNAEKMVDYLDSFFPQRFDQCSPGWGRGCSYRRLCHGRVDDPLSQGYTWRVPHHQPEVDAQAAE